jgi:hypothetical protein
VLRIENDSNLIRLSLTPMATGFTTSYTPDTPPPGDIPSATLNGIQVQFEFSRARTSMKGAKRKREGKAHLAAEDDADLLFDSEDEAHAHFPASQPITSTSDCVASHVSKAASQPEPIPFLDDELLDDQPAVPRDIHNTVRARPFDRAGSRKRRCEEASLAEYIGTMPHTMNHSSIDSAVALRLVGSALQRIIYRGGPRAARGIRLLSEVGGPRLAEVAPIVFSPKYFQACKQVFTPWLPD